jgi:hypothetical protein
MNTQLILSFSLLLGATIALICAVYTFIGMRRKQKQLLKNDADNDEK